VISGIGCRAHRDDAFTLDQDGYVVPWRVRSSIDQMRGPNEVPRGRHAVSRGLCMCLSEKQRENEDCGVDKDGGASKRPANL